MIKKILITTFIIGYFAKALCADNLKQHFTGVSEDLLKNIEARVQANQEAAVPLSSQDELQTRKEETLIEIKNALAPYGYLQPEIKTSTKHFKNSWIINYQIFPGPLLHIDTLDFVLSGEGAQDKAFQKLILHFPIKEGDVLLSKKYQEAKSNLVDLAAQRGYFAAKMESKILIDLKKYRATVILHFNTGPRYTFGQVFFSSSPYCEKFLTRFLRFKYGDPYNNNKLIKLQEDLSNTNFFQQVNVSSKPEYTQELNVPVNVDLVPRKRFQYSLGGGFGTDTGVRGLAGFQLRRLNCMGHHFEGRIQASQKQNHYEASYSIPGANPATDLYRFSVAAEEQHLSTSGKSRTKKVEASHISTVWGWQQTLSLSLRDEHSVPTEDRPIVNSTILLPSINWSKVKSDNLLSPNCGYQLNINLRGASKSLISNTDFAQALIQGKVLYSLTNDTRLILRGQLGYTYVPDINDLPNTLQFFTGGAQTVRGYQYEDIGPGKTLLIGSIEFQQRIRGNLYAAVFMDAGNVSNSLFNDLNKSVGVGLVWRSPIGAIAITLAQALDKPGQPRLVQFSMGPEL